MCKKYDMLRKNIVFVATNFVIFNNSKAILTLQFQDKVLWYFQLAQLFCSYSMILILEWHEEYNLEIEKSYHNEYSIDYIRPNVLPFICLSLSNHLYVIKPHTAPKEKKCH